MTSEYDLEKFRFNWAALLPISQHLPGTGGILRQQTEDFRVQEIPLYLPSGQGSHAYALVEKRNLTTRDLVLALLKAGVAENAIGVAGLKDKRAVTRQWLSVPNRQAAALAELEALDGVRVLETSRHKNKLGIGHLQGNRFSIRVRQAEVDALARAQAIVDLLIAQGVPNYFGPQRFGRFGNNAIDGLKLLRGEWVPGGHRLKRFFLSSLQSLLFNHLLNLRIERGLYQQVINGDWAKKHDTGGVFLVESAEIERARAENLAISATLPLFGKKVKLSPTLAGELELETFRYFALRWQDFTRLKGSRRISRVKLAEVELQPTEDGYIFSFVLPKGSFATSVLREIMKVDIDVVADEELKAAEQD